MGISSVGALHAKQLRGEARLLIPTSLQAFTLESQVLPASRGQQREIYAQHCSHVGSFMEQDDSTYANVASFHLALETLVQK